MHITTCKRPVHTYIRTYSMYSICTQLSTSTEYFPSSVHVYPPTHLHVGGHLWLNVLVLLCKVDCLHCLRSLLLLRPLLVLARLALEVFELVSIKAHKVL